MVALPLTDARPEIDLGDPRALEVAGLDLLSSTTMPPPIDPTATTLPPIFR
jgi:hypothetical protein